MAAAVYSLLVFLVSTNFDSSAGIFQFQPEQIHLSYGRDETQMILTWSTRNNTDSSLIQYGRSMDKMNQEVNGTRTYFNDGGPHQLSQYFHRAVMIGLIPGETYYYICGSKYGWSDLYKFKAMPKGDSWSPRLVMFGDMGSVNAKSLPWLQEEMPTYDAILHIGDFAYDLDSLSDVGAVEAENVTTVDALDQDEAICNAGESESFNQSTATSNLDVSVALHDYMGQVDINNLPTFRHKEVQHDAEMCNSFSQTEPCKFSTASKLIQTDLQPKTRSVHVQTDIVPELTIQDIKEKEMMFYTGLPDKGTFNVLFEELTSEKEDSDHSAGGRPRKLNPIDEFFMVLMRLRLVLLELDLAKRFRVSQATVSNVFNTWIEKMYSKLSFLVWWTPRDVVQANMPHSFKERYPSTRVIIDCTEIFTESPTSLINKSLVYSDYKSHNTWKVLVGISPSGTITYVSDLWGGNTSDKQIVARSNLLDLCDKGDAIMADKGFQIQDMLIPRGIYLIIPPKKKPNKKFNSREVEATRRIANLRIHVERAMERIKNFRILQGVVPLSMSENIDKVFKVCCYLCNLQPQLITK